MTVAEIAEKLGGILEGDGSAEVTGPAGLQDARPGDITFLSNPRYASAVAKTRASAVIVNEDWTGSCPCAVIKVRNVDKAFAAAASLLGPRPVEHEPGVHSTAVVADDAETGQCVCIGPYCVIEPGVKIGDRTSLGAGCYLGHETVLGKDCRLYPHVSTREYTRIGDRTVIHNGTVIGSDGFGYFKEGDAWKKIPQAGIIEIGDDVEIGANVTIDRARFGKTVIGSGVKIDNLVQIAHNVKIGDNTAMAAQIGISGSVTIGRNVQIGGQSGFAGHLTIGDGAVIGGGAGVTKDVPPETFVSGYPAMPHDKAAKMHAHVMRLPELKKKVKEMEERISALEKKEKRSEQKATKKTKKK